MSLLYNVLYAAHARGTHHKLALDALANLDVPDALRWRRLFLKNAPAYMAGAKAPDDVFKDFKNHVLHPRDGFWGGAPGAARAWYAKTVDLLKASDWSQAVHAAGVLSHYVTDPVQPFHTGQSEAESSIHRAFEWSTAKSYEDLVAIAAAGPAPVIAAADGEDWLEEMLRAAALRSNAFYEKCLVHYDINKGAVDPPAGLDDVSRRIVGGLIRYASALFSCVLSRAIREANVAPPDVSLTLDTVLATLQIPVKVLANRLADRAEREQVLSMYDELRATGTVEASLPEDDRTVRDLHAVEVAGKARAIQTDAMQPSADPVANAPKKGQSPARLSDRIESARRDEGARTSAPRLGLADDVVDAPSIGPRMAERLAVLGIKTVADLLVCDPEAVAGQLEVSYVKSHDVASWQAQARLVLAVPGLSGTGAQLLVGAGYREPAAIAAAEPAQLLENVHAFAAGAAGQRILRDREPPESAQITEWAENTRRALAA
jgi:predicted flap endonuclease-1-like 5' DNA nuclease